MAGVNFLDFYLRKTTLDNIRKKNYIVFSKHQSNLSHLSTCLRQKLSIFRRKIYWRSLYFSWLSAYFCVMYLEGIAISVIMHVLSLLFFKKSRLFVIFWSVSTSMFRNYDVSGVSMTVTGSCLFHFSWTFMPKSLQMFQCRYTPTVLWRSRQAILPKYSNPIL